MGLTANWFSDAEDSYLTAFDFGRQSDDSLPSPGLLGVPIIRASCASSDQVAVSTHGTNSTRSPGGPEQLASSEPTLRGTLHFQPSVGYFFVLPLLTPFYLLLTPFYPILVYMQEFEKRYKALNTNQKKAVDTLDGPVMVVAGPGTGKTELLSIRVANILQKTDALPQNILCLTFTDSGAVAIRERLAGLLGPEAYKVAIHTFHSFGSEVINQYGDFFYEGAHFRPADELSSYEILSELLARLPHDNPLGKKMNDRYTHLGDIKRTISELKRGGLTPDELDIVLEKNDAFVTWMQPKLAEVFATRLSKSTLAAARSLVHEIEQYQEEPVMLPTYHALYEIIAHSLTRALDEAEAADSTKPLTAWKNTYLEKNAHDEQTLKDEKRCHKLHALSSLYYDYLVAMQQAELYDYDDMILRVVHALELFDALRFSLQEQYQYLLVDEFQDTNDAQMRLVWNLTNNAASEGRPNLMVVGDDDQAIYRFQGAELSNILDFTNRYRNVAVIPLTDNYRSAEPILSTARSVITQAEERLETTLSDLSKELTPHHDAEGSIVTGRMHETIMQSHAALAQHLAADVKKHPKSSRAVIARHHRELLALLPHLTKAGVSVIYEHQENVLESEPVRQLELAAHVVWHIAREEFDAANQHLSELLAHPAWGIAPRDIWELSLEAHRDKRYWLEIMLTRDGALRSIAEWLIVGAQYAKTEPLEAMLDYLFGIGEQTTEFVSPYKQYFFGDPTLSPLYIAHLSALQKIRSALRDYRPDSLLKLDDFIDYLSLHHELGLGLTASSQYGEHASVTLLSAHKAKGLEFDAVYILDAHETVWGSGARSRSRLITFPSNLPLSPASDTDDERLRLLYVALTRARNELVVMAAETNEQGKELLPVGALNGLEFVKQPSLSVEAMITAAETSWAAPLLDVATADQRAILAPLLERYKLSATHLNNFLDVRQGGPEYFLLHNLLRLPEAMSPSAAYGSAVHTVLQRAHQHFAATGKKRPVEDVIHDFEALVHSSQLSDLDRDAYTVRGVQALTAFFEQRYKSFSPSQLVERDFSSEHVTVGSAILTGKIDLIDIDHDEKTIFVTDYKTGKAARAWHGRDDFEKVKLHHYEQQLMLYKLLIEHSRQFSGYIVTGARLEFVEPDERGDIVLLDYVYEAEKLAAFEKLVGAVWQRIMTTDFTLASPYDASYKGILAFEDDLVA